MSINIQNKRRVQPLVNVGTPGHIDWPSLKDQQAPMSKFAWLTRCQMQFARRTQDFSHDWSDFAEALFEHYKNDGFENDPEGAADEDMSYWD